MYKEEHINNVDQLLQDQSTYVSIKTDPTSKYQKEAIIKIQKVTKGNRIIEKASQKLKT